MACSRDLVDDDVAHPSLAAVPVELVPISSELDRGSDLDHQPEVDPRRLTIAPLGEPTFDRGQPRAEVAADVTGQRTEPGEDRVDAAERVGFVRKLELEIVDLARELPVAIDQLAVEQFEHRPHLTTHAPLRGGHDPAFVAIISGMVGERPRS